MNKDVTVTARIDGGLSERLSRLAEIQGRSKSWVVGRALRAYLDTELAFAEAVEDGLQDVRDGRTAPHDEVAARLRARFGTGE